MGLNSNVGNGDALTQCCVTGRRRSRRQYAEGENRAEWAVGRRSRLKAHGRGTGLQRGGLRALASRRSEQRGAAEPAAHVEVRRRGISCAFNSYGIAWCFTAASSQVKQKQWWTTPLLKMLEMESGVSSPLL